jgi:deazaflavin-dependent oxidoreductase (nitroreductase family)
MPISEQIARFNRVVTNRISRRLAGRMPPFALIHHVGRVSGTRYQTPVWMFRDGERFIVALTYGTDADWLQNVIAAGSCDITYRHQTVREVVPEVITAAPSMLPLPGPIRVALHALGVDQFLLLRPPAEGLPDTRRVGQIPP